MKKLMKSKVGLYFLTFFFSLTWFSSCLAINKVNNSDHIDFKTQLQFYLDMKVKRFLQKMSIKEMLLLQTIQNASEEIQLRGKERLIKDGVGFDLIYGESNKLFDSYTKEIDTIINIIDEIERLEAIIKKNEDLKLLNEVDEIKNNLISALEDRKLTKDQITQKKIISMINEYSHEVNSLLKLYDEIDLFERKAKVIGDQEILKKLEQQKSRIFTILGLSRIGGYGADKAVEEYISEASNLIYILKELDRLETEAEFKTDSLLIISNVDSFRNELIKNIDNRILNLFGYTSNLQPQGATISDYFREWKAKRLAEFQLKLAQARIVRNQLIKTATQSEKNRMLESDLTDALINYTDGKYELAISQFNEIHKTYKPYYENLDGVIFYTSEANYMSGYFDAAYDGFIKITEEYPNSQFLGASYMRLMLICYTYGWFDKFFDCFNSYQLLSQKEFETNNEANYLAGYIYAEQRQYVEARKVLENVVKDSEYYMAAQYLLAIVYTNLDNYSKAKLIFENLIDKKNYPWTDLNTTIIQNEALLKLGYLHFQRGEYDRALQYFEQVSKGYEKYDLSLMGQAWAKMKKGDYDASINRIDILTSSYLLSNYTYEAFVLAAHCKQIQNKNRDALKDLRYVTDAKEALKKTKEYNEERQHILAQMDELEQLEEQILERQDRKLFPKVVKIRDTINKALTSFYYRGSISNRVLEEYNDERKILIQQIQEFESIIKFAEEQQNEKMYQDAKTQRDRLLLVLETYQTDNVMTINSLIDYPLAIKESGTLYREDIITNTINELLLEKKRMKKDLEMISELLTSSDSEIQMEVLMDLEILEEDLHDLHNQLNKFQVWLANHQVTETQTNADLWADFSGFGISDINYTTYYEQIQKMNTLTNNIEYIDDMLNQKKEVLLKRISRFDNEVLKIQKELEAEKIRLEKLEKEKYFREIYFETKTKEIEESDDSYDFKDLEL